MGCWRDAGGMLEGCWRDAGGMDAGGVLEECWRDGCWRGAGGMLEASSREPTIFQNESWECFFYVLPFSSILYRAKIIVITFL